MIRGKSRLLTALPKIKPDNNITDTSLMGLIHNRFDIEVVDSITGKIKQRAQAFNTVLDTWWKYPTNKIDRIYYGGGSGIPSRTDTKLFSEIGYVSTIGTTSSDTSTYLHGYISMTFSGQLGPADAVGTMITEVGLAKYYSSGLSGYNALCTHAMLQDMNGNPIAITKTETDIINLHGTVFLHFGTTGYRNKSILICDPAFLLMWCGDYYSATDKKIKLYGNADIYSDATSSSSAAAVSIADGTWDQNSKTFTIPFNRAAVNAANLDGGIYVLHFVTHSSILGSIATPHMFIHPVGTSRITGEAIGTADGVTSQFKTKFHFPQNATVYVDGVAKTSGVTVEPDCNNASSMNKYLLRLDENSTKDCIFGSRLTTNTRVIAAGTAIFEYLFCDVVAITNLTFNASGATLYASTDLGSWEKIGTTGSSTTSKTLSIPAKYGKYKYWKVETATGVTLSGGQGENLNGYAIRFDEAPANGSVITVDYDTPMIPKDEDRVMDMSLSFVFGEYSEI